MSSITVCVRFRPLSYREKRDHGDVICIRSLDTESFVFKDEKEEDFTFCFDRVFYQSSAQADVYEFLALPIVQDAINGINGTIITYGQTGAGKTYSMEGPSITGCDDERKGLLARVVDGIFECIRSADEMFKYTVKLSMVEIYMEKVRDGRVKTGKLFLVDLAGSEKVEKTGAEGRILEEAKTINKSLSVLGNVVNALTNGKVNHVPYRDSKLTRILRDALGGNSRTALLCCCSPSTSNASESLSTLRFGARTKHIRMSPRGNSNGDKVEEKQVTLCQINNKSCDKILDKLKATMNVEDVKLLEELFIVEGIIFDLPYSMEDFDSLYEDVTSCTISSLHQAVEELTNTVQKLERDKDALMVKLVAAEQSKLYRMNAAGNSHCWDGILGILAIFSFFSLWLWGFWIRH